MRLENLADLFDGQTPSESPIFDLHKYALDLYSASNNGSTKVSIRITERTLTNTLDHHDWVKEKFVWPTEHHSKEVVAVYPEDKIANKKVAL